ncbi:MAG: PAS domain-containing protein [Pseudomonadota bacterium]
MTQKRTETMNDFDKKLEDGEDVGAMRYNTTRELFGYWNRIRRSRFAPWRSEIEPSDIHMLLPDVFIIETYNTMDYRYRLAGTRLCAAYRKELKGRDFLELWNDADREGFETLLHNVARDGAVGVVQLVGSTDRDQHLPFELVVLPLRHHDGRVSRFLGAMSAAESPYWLGVNPVISQKARSVRLIWPDEEAAETRQAFAGLGNGGAAGQIASSSGRRFGHLTVIDGGKDV